jgi:membrane fusion protein, epimerase transport system
MNLSLPKLVDDPNSPFGTTLPFAGVSILAVFCLAFGIWSATAPLDAAVVAPGVVSVDSNVRSVQHLEGGIISDILVREGDQVRRGQPLVRVAQTPASANLNEIKAQYFDAVATEARLEAERDGAARITFPIELLNSNDPVAATAIAAQQSLFQSWRGLLAERLSGQGAVVQGSASETRGLQEQAQQARQKLIYLNQQLQLFGKLVDKGLVSKVRMLSLQQEKADLQGTIASYEASSSSARQKSDEARSQMAQIKAGSGQDVLAQLRDAQTRVYGLRQKLREAEDVAKRVEVRSPADGAVVGLKIHTIGGVIAPGEVLMNIVPAGDELIVQANINPDDIDQVGIGMPASVWLSTTTRRNQDPLEGAVRTISADRLVDAKTGAAYYLARISLDPGSLKSRGIALQPGMSADVMVKTGSHSAIGYLLGPLFQSMSFASR